MTGTQYTSDASWYASAIVSKCEHERVWETKCVGTGTTGGADTLAYRSYSCACFFCPYPTIKCHVKNMIYREEAKKNEGK